MESICYSAFYFLFLQPVCKSLTRTRDDLTLMSTWQGTFMRWKISTTVYNTLKTDTKYSHSVFGRPTLKDEERLRNGLVRKPYERSLYKRTFMGEPFIEEHTISTELSNVKREKHKLRSHRVCRRNREPSIIPIRSLKGLRFARLGLLPINTPFCLRLTQLEKNVFTLHNKYVFRLLYT